jgi:hypothetical protein
MSKKKKATEGKVAEAQDAPVEAPKAAKSKPVPVLSFDRWFAQTGRPAHHKAGMHAYLSKGVLRMKRTVAAWNALFQNY